MAFGQHLRRAATEVLVGEGLRATASLSIDQQHRAVRSLVTLASGVPMLRRKVHENMRLALGPDVPTEAADLYFRRIGWFLSNSLSTFHHGIANSPVVNEITFDNSVEVLDQAIARGRGVVLASPHWCGHELAAAKINCRHPMTFVVRRGSTPERMARKLSWYGALGSEIVLRPNNASTIKDAVSYLRVLKRNRILAITPDLITSADSGVSIQVFGRAASVFGGAFAIAISAGATMLRPTLRWRSDTSAVISFECGPDFSNVDDRKTAVRDATADWWHWFEAKLRASPESWSFWLDKRWSRFLHTTPRTAQPV